MLIQNTQERHPLRIEIHNLEIGVVMPNWMAEKVIVVPHWQIMLEVYPLECWRKPFMERHFAGSMRTQNYLSEVSEEAAGHCVLLTVGVRQPPVAGH